MVAEVCHSGIYLGGRDANQGLEAASSKDAMMRGDWTEVSRLALRMNGVIFVAGG